MFIKIVKLTENSIVSALLELSPTHLTLPLSSQGHIESRGTSCPNLYILQVNSFPQRRVIDKL